MSTLTSEYVKRYAAGESIRRIADDAGRSFGFVHGVLKEAGVGLRGRGGATRSAKKAAVHCGGFKELGMPFQSKLPPQGPKRRGPASRRTKRLLPKFCENPY